MGYTLPEFGDSGALSGFSGGVPPSDGSGMELPSGFSGGVPPSSGSAGGVSPFGMPAGASPFGSKLPGLPPGISPKPDWLSLVCASAAAQR